MISLKVSRVDFRVLAKINTCKFKIFIINIELPWLLFYFIVNGMVATKVFLSETHVEWGHSNILYESYKSIVH